MNLDLAQSYAQIVKQEKQADGTLKVYGKATDDSVDIDQQICDEAWLKQAMPDWFTTGGNVREQHSNIAAGVATDYEVKSDGHYITALVVDPVSVKKVETGVLKGFSIGIRAPRVIRDNKAANGRIVGGQIVEVSLVDRPANPNAKLMLAKAAESGELMAVKQSSIPTPADMAKSLKKSADEVDAEIVETVEAVEAVDDIEIVEAEVEAVVDAENADIELPEEIEGDSDDEGVEKSADVLVAEGVELINIAKGALADLLKFDQATYDAACAALYDLIIVEANEGKQGSDERESIKELLHSIKHLYNWFDGEADEGEVAGVLPSEDNSVSDYLALSADKSADACECDCDKCADAKGCDAKVCKCASTKSAEVDDVIADDIIAKAVASAKASVSSELESLKAAQTAAEQRAIQLEADLANALSKTANGGPMRAAVVKTKSANVDDLLVKAADYNTKASLTQDAVLAKGYRELAESLTKKARKAERTNS